jgi:hypothetical protein
MLTPERAYPSVAIVMAVGATAAISTAGPATRRETILRHYWRSPYSERRGNNRETFEVVIGSSERLVPLARMRGGIWIQIP